MSDWGYVNNSRFRFLSIRNQGGGVEPVPPKPAKYIITTEDDGVASIKPEGEIEMNEGESITFNMIGSDGYRPTIDSIDNIKISAYGISSYIFEDVNANHSISITNSITTEKSSIVTPHAYKGGKISPKSRTVISLNKPTTFTITPNEGYEIDKVLIDGHNVGAVSEYTFTFTELEFHLIEAFFKEAKPTTTYTVTVSYNLGGDHEYTVNAGESYSLGVSVRKGYHLTSVLDNNVEVISQVVNNQYTIASVNEDHTIVITYESDR